jgi:MarR family transcriptional regulator for hemolysin
MSDRTLTGGDREHFAQLLAATARAWRYALDARLQPLGLSPAQWMVLLHVSRADEPLTQTALAARYGVEGPTMAGLLDRMERSGWIERRVSETDRRSKTVHLTETARRLSRRIERVAGQLRTELLEDIPDEDIACCMQLLTRICDRARVRDGDSPDGTDTPRSGQRGKS